MQPEDVQTPSSRRVVWNLAMALLCVCLLASLVLWLRHTLSAEAQTRAQLQLVSANFANGAAMPRRYTCDGADVSPALQWSAPPENTRSFALLVDDPDAPAEFTHWIAFDIPAEVRQLSEAASPRGPMPQGSGQGTNSFGGVGYSGPCPPAARPHHYLFRIFALDTPVVLAPGASRQQLEAAMQRHILAAGQLVGTYRRAGR